MFLQRTILNMSKFIVILVFIISLIAFYMGSEVYSKHEPPTKFFTGNDFNLGWIRIQNINDLVNNWKKDKHYSADRCQLNRMCYPIYPLKGDAKYLWRAQSITNNKITKDLSDACPGPISPILDTCYDNGGNPSPVASNYDVYSTDFSDLPQIKLLV